MVLGKKDSLCHITSPSTTETADGMVFMFICNVSLIYVVH